MAASNSGGAGAGPLSAEAAAALGEGVSLVFGRWTALQIAVENQWGGRDSRAKADKFGASILTWFRRSKGPHYFKVLVDMMDNTISESFNAIFEDGSVEEVAEQLWIMHEDCQQRNYSSIEKLRNSRVQGSGVSQSRRVAVDGNDDSDSSDNEGDASMMDDEVDGTDDSDSSDDEGDASMMDDEVDGNDDSDSSDDEGDASMMDDDAAAPEGIMAVDKPKPSKPVPDGDGWTVVPPKLRGKNRHRRKP